MRIKAILERIGKVPVSCAASPGYVVPRIQGIVMNEAARLVEEGVATAEDVEKAVKYGFGFRFSVLGLNSSTGAAEISCITLVAT